MKSNVLLAATLALCASPVFCSAQGLFTLNLDQTNIVYNPTGTARFGVNIKYTNTNPNNDSDSINIDNALFAPPGQDASNAPNGIIAPDFIPIGKGLDTGSTVDGFDEGTFRFFPDVFSLNFGVYNGAAPAPGVYDLVYTLKGTGGSGINYEGTASFSVIVGSVPEPGTVALLVSGLTAAGWMRARRRKR